MQNVWMALAVIMYLGAVAYLGYLGYARTRTTSAAWLALRITGPLPSEHVERCFGISGLIVAGERKEQS